MNKLDLIQFVKCASVFGVVWSPVPLVSCVCDNVDDDENNIQGTKTTTTKYLNPFSQKEGEDDEKGETTFLLVSVSMDPLDLVQL